jgi:hypothetical protein
MSSLWSVKIQKIENKTVELKVKMVHPDAGLFPENIAFALDLLLQPAYKYQLETHNRVPVGALGKAITFDKALDINYLNKVAPEYVESVVVTEARNMPWIEGSQDLNNLPYAIYLVTATDEQWVEHIELNNTFESAAYSNNGPWVESNR